MIDDNKELIYISLSSEAHHSFSFSVSDYCSKNIINPNYSLSRLLSSYIMVMVPCLCILKYRMALISESTLLENTSHC